MKKIVAILFLFVLVFTSFGYRWVLSLLEQRATMRLEQKLDAGNFATRDLTEIKIPLHLPYYSNWGEYQSYAGEVEMNGSNYQYVKRKIVGDTLFLLCIAHTEKDKLEQAKTDFSKSANDFAQNTPSQNGKIPAAVKLMLSKFLVEGEEINFSEAQKNKSNNKPCNTSINSQSNPLPLVHPPEC